MLGDELGGVGRGQVAGLEPQPGALNLQDAIDPEGPPVGAVAVPADEIPPSAARYQLERLNAAPSLPAVTRAEQVATIGAAIGRDLQLVEITADEFAGETAAFIPPEIVSMLLSYWADTVDTPDLVRTAVRDLTGHPGRTLAQWATDHRADFGAR